MVLCLNLDIYITTLQEDQSYIFFLAIRNILLVICSFVSLRFPIQITFEKKIVLEVFKRYQENSDVLKVLEIYQENSDFSFDLVVFHNETGRDCDN